MLLLTSLVSFGFLPVRLIGVALLIASVVFFILEVKAPGLGIWSIAGLICLVAGGLFLYDGSGGVQVSPWVLIAVGGLVALFFGVAVSKLLAIRHCRRSPRRRGAHRQGGRGDQRGLGPDGVVRVGSEEWGGLNVGSLARRHADPRHRARRVGAHRRAAHR